MTAKRGEKLSMEELGRKTVSEYRSSNKLPIVVVLDDIRSLNNIGSVFRTSDAFAIEKVYLCGITAQPPHREIQKTALGATESVDWEYQESCLETVQNLAQSGFSVIGVEQVTGSIDLSEFKTTPDSKIALVFGNEVKGVSQLVLDECANFLEIPQNGTKHSLNVSVSVGVVLWELSRSFRK